MENKNQYEVVNKMDTTMNSTCLIETSVLVHERRLQTDHAVNNFFALLIIRD